MYFLTNITNIFTYIIIVREAFKFAPTLFPRKTCFKRIIKNFGNTFPKLNPRPAKRTMIFNVPIFPLLHLLFGPLNWHFERW